MMIRIQENGMEFSICDRGKKHEMGLKFFFSKDYNEVLIGSLCYSV